jgi:transposase
LSEYQRRARHPDAALIRSLPGIGATLTAEFLAITGGIDRYPSGDQLAAAAGIAPVRKQSGKVSYLRRARAGDKVLKRVFYQSASSPSVATQPARPTTDANAPRARTTSKPSSRSRRRVNVLHAIMRTRQPYDHRPAA